MSGQRDLSARQRAFVAALASGQTQTGAAQVAGVAESTGRRYMRTPAVRAALTAAQDDALGEVCRALSAGGRAALDVLTSVMHDRKAPAGVRLRAALGWLETTFKARELLDLAERVAELEARIGEERG